MVSGLEKLFKLLDGFVGDSVPRDTVERIKEEILEDKTLCNGGADELYNKIKKIVEMRREEPKIKVEVVRNSIYLAKKGVDPEVLLIPEEYKNYTDVIRAALFFALSKDYRDAEKIYKEFEKEKDFLDSLILNSLGVFDENTGKYQEELSRSIFTRALDWVSKNLKEVKEYLKNAKKDTEVYSFVEEIYQKI